MRSAEYTVQYVRCILWAHWNLVGWSWTKTCCTWWCRNQFHSWTKTDSNQQSEFVNILLQSHLSFRVWVKRPCLMCSRCATETAGRDGQNHRELLQLWKADSTQRSELQVFLHRIIIFVSCTQIRSCLLNKLSLFRERWKMLIFPSFPVTQMRSRMESLCLWTRSRIVWSNTSSGFFGYGSVCPWWTSMFAGSSCSWCDSANGGLDRVDLEQTSWV